MKFFNDMPLSPDLAIWLTGQGHDAVHVSKRGLEPFRGKIFLKSKIMLESSVKTKSIL